MSLARTLLNGVTESVNIEGYEDIFESASMEDFYLDAACESLVTDIYSTDKAYHVADIMGEVQVLKEGADGQALLEGMIQSGIEKLKEGFKKFLAKIKGWFAQVKKFFKSLTLKGKDFVKEFRKEIIDKKATGFKYHAFKYTISDGESKCNSVMDKVNAQIDKLAMGIKEADRTTATADYMTKNIKEIKGINLEQSSSDYQDEIVKSCGIGGASTSSELSEELAKAFRNGEDAAEDFEEFESNGKEEMMSLVENVEKKVKDIEDDEKKFEKGVNAIIKALDGVKKSDNEQAYKLATKYSSLASAMLSLGKVPSTVRVAAYKEAANAYRSILGSFVRFKPAKEGTELEMEDDGETGTEEGCGGSKKGCKESTLFEAALKMI